MILPALLKPILNCLCSIPIEPLSLSITNLPASSNRVSLSSCLSTAALSDVFCATVSAMLSSYCASSVIFSLRKSTTLDTSSSDTKAPCTLIGLGMLDGKYSISPLPRSFSAPFISRIVLESTPDDTENAILDGTLALISPVITLTDGLCVAITICMPAALASCASLHMASSTSPGATIIRSASSSTIITI